MTRSWQQSTGDSEAAALRRRNAGASRVACSVARFATTRGRRQSPDQRKSGAAVLPPTSIYSAVPNEDRDLR